MTSRGIKSLAAVFLAVGMLAGCSKNNDTETQSSQGEPIDTTVVGKDTNPVSTRKGIEKSDEEKLTLPGRDTTNSDEPKK